MNRIWPWIAGVVVTVLLIILVSGGGPGRQARYRALGAYGHQTPVIQSQADAAAQKAFVLHILAVRGRR